MKRGVLTCALLVLSSVAAKGAAAEPAPLPTPTPIGALERKAVVAELGQQLRDNYIFPDVAERIATALREKEVGQGYAAATNVESFSQALTADLRAAGNDLHFQVFHEPEFEPQQGSMQYTDTLPDPEELATARRFAFGVESVQRLPGNVGYLEVRAFGPPELVSEALSAAMLLVSGTEALILDLRRNGGGDPASVAYLLSHFFALGDERHLNDIYSRATGKTQQYWTNNAVMPRYIRPIYVLTSKDTFSGGEECAYDLQTQKRATLVGETTGGAANPGETFAIGHGLVAFIPNMQSINPITKSSWEHTGVKPDIAAPAADAQRVAHVAILRHLITKNADDPQARAKLQERLAEIEATAPPSKS